MAPRTAGSREIAVEIDEGRAGQVTFVVSLPRGRSLRLPPQIHEARIAMRAHPFRVDEEGNVRHVRILHRPGVASDTKSRLDCLLVSYRWGRSRERDA